MSNKVIRLSESDLHRIVETTVNEVISEGWFDTVKSFGKQYANRGANKAKQIGSNVGASVGRGVNKIRNAAQNGVQNVRNTAQNIQNDIDKTWQNANQDRYAKEMRNAFEKFKMAVMNFKKHGGKTDRVLSSRITGIDNMLNSYQSNI